MNTWQEKISRVGFFTSAAAYVVFWIADLLRPGFVARYFSVHFFLLAAVVFGAWWMRSVREYHDWPFFQYAFAVAFGALFATLTWNVGAGFESYRLLAVAVAAVTPAVILSLVRLE